MHWIVSRINYKSWNLPLKYTAGWVHPDDSFLELTLEWRLAFIELIDLKK